MSAKPTMPAAYYGIIDPDYARIYTQARIIAWQYGYACVMHGSFTRDLDLLLVPWTDKARGNDEQMLKLIAQACGLRFRDGLDEVYKSKADWDDKPHGRRACSLFFPTFGDRRWVDLSVMPCRTPAQPPVSFEVALSLAGFYESTWVGDLGDLETLWEKSTAPAQPLTDEQKDATRYRWLFNDVATAALKDSFENNKPLPDGLRCEVLEQLIGFYNTKAEADALIDAAIESDHEIKVPA